MMYLPVIWRARVVRALIQNVQTPKSTKKTLMFDKRTLVLATENTMLVFVIHIDGAQNNCDDDEEPNVRPSGLCTGESNNVTVQCSPIH